MRYLLIVLFGWLPLLAHALDFDDSVASLPLGRAMQVYEDPTGEATFAQVRAADLAGQFLPQQEAVLNKGYSTSAFWIRLDLRYQPRQSEGPRNWLLELAYPPLDHVDLYLADAADEFRLAQRTGDSLPYSSRQIRQNNYVFDIAFTPQVQRTIYLRVASQGSVQVPLTLWDGHAYVEDQPARLYILGLIYGVLLGMLVYNLFIYLSVRDTSYLYYIIYIASFGLYQVSVNGAGVEFFWPDNPWWANAATPFLIGASALFGSQFARAFLLTATHSRWLDRLLLALMAFSAMVMLMALSTSYGLALRLATALALGFTVVVFTTAVVAWRRGVRSARYFIIAWSAFLLGGIVNTLMVLGYLPNVFITMYASQIGSALEVGLLSLALADRINTMRDQQSRVLQESGQKLELLNQRLANSNRLKDEFLATVTHELRTPMNGVIGSLELMQTVPMTPELGQYQHTAAVSARDMMRMVDDILILTELQAGKLYPRHEPFSLQALLDSMQLQFARQAAAKGLAFNVERVAGLPDQLLGDAKKLALCLGCLLDNGIKFTHQGAVSLRVEGTSASPDAVQLSFSVSDSGIGFSQMDDGALYQRFYQLDGSMTREYGGLGIGLAICRQLAELLGGTLQHQSEPGRGSRFQLCLQLPVIEPHPARASITRQAAFDAQRPAHDCTVLLLADDSINQLVVRGMLLKLGYRVRTAEDASVARRLLEEQPFDALVMDGRQPLPELLAIGRSLQTLPAAGAMAFLIISAENSRSARESCQAAGFNACLSRPLRFEALQAALHEWVLARPQPLGTV